MIYPVRIHDMLPSYVRLSQCSNEDTADAVYLKPTRWFSVSNRMLWHSGISLHRLQQYPEQRISALILLRLHGSLMHSISNSLVKHLLRQKPCHPVQHGVRHPRGIQPPAAPNPSHDRLCEAVRGGAHEGCARLVAIGLDLADGDAREAHARRRAPELLVVVEGTRESADERLRGGVCDEAWGRDVRGDGADELRNDGTVPGRGTQLGEESACEEEGEHGILVDDAGETRIREAVDAVGRIQFQ